MLSRANTQISRPTHSDEAPAHTPSHIFAWGDDGFGQCLGGAPSSVQSIVSTPRQVRMPDGERDFAQVGVGWEQSFLVSARGRLWGGGSNRGRCLVEEDDAEQALGLQRLDFAEADGLEFAAVDAGREHFVAVEQEGKALVTWGSSNELGQTGQGADRVGLGPCAMRRFLLGSGVRVCAVACGMDHALALTSQGEVFSWGGNSHGQLGVQRSKSSDSGSLSEPSPRRVPTGALRGLPVRQIAAGQQHSMVLGVSGQVVGWGCNRHGRLGLGPAFGEMETVPLPTLVQAVPGAVRSLAAGGRHSAVVLRGGVTLLAGDNRSGQLGQSPESCASSDLFLPLPDEFSAVQVRSAALGEAHSFLLSYEGELFGMGANDRGQLGDTPCPFVHTLRKVILSNPNWIVWAVAAGPGHCVALASECQARLPRPNSRLGNRSPLRSASCTQPRHSEPAMSHVVPPSFNEEEADEEDDDVPLMRCDAYQGGSLAQPMSVDDQSESEPLERLNSKGCSSKAAKSGKLVVAISPKSPSQPSDLAEDSTSEAPTANAAMFLRPVVRPGVAAGVVFACLTIDELAGMVQALPAESSIADKMVQDLRIAMSAALECPTILGSCFLFPALYEAKLNATALSELLLQARGKLDACLDVERQWAASTLKGIQALAPPGGVLRNLCSRDQVRSLVSWLMVPNWPLLLTGYPDQTGGSSGVFEVASELLRTIARLPATGRQAFRNLVAEECGDAATLRDILLPAARAFANACVRHCAKKARLESPIWEALLLLQLLWSAEAKRLQSARAAALAVRELERSNSAVPSQSLAGRIGRSLSKTTHRDSVHPEAPAASLALPRTCFQVESLIEVGFPPELELKLFLQHAKMQPVDTEELVTDPKWEMDARGQLPLPFMSFMANGNLIPVSFKQQVLQVENTVRQAEEQHRQVMTQAGGLMQILPFVQVSPDTVFFVLQVRREQLLHDTMVNLQNAAPGDLRKPLKVKFVGEDGVDEGGVAKEYFRLLGEQLFAPEYGMFKADAESRYLWFDPGSFNDPEDFWTVGAVLGLAVYNNLPGLDVHFPPALFKKLKEQPLSLEDLAAAFPSHSTSLQAVLDWRPPEGLGAEEADRLFQDTFFLDFSVSYDVLGDTRTENLLGGDGDPPPVTLDRREEFAEAFKEWHLNKGVAKQFDPFFGGFSRVCGSPVFNCLSAAELEAIVCGEKDLDFSRLRKGSTVLESHVHFRDGYLDDFWAVLDAMDAAQKRQFLSFVTGSDLAPVGGLERLGLKIQRDGGEPTDRLPTSRTCFNLLLLPEYESVAKLKRLIITAIESASGFGLE